jgi:hypothetical protein
MENILMENISVPETYDQLSELNDMKQHADKIIQGIKKLEENDANRAIWELFQNAVDISPDCEVHIKLTEDSLQFSHNGTPFTPMTLDCLFKQVSSKTLEERKITLEEGEPIGQYGTGFITTHSFGKEISIDGALVKDNGYIPIQNFVIDRHTDNWKELGENIRGLKRTVRQLLNTVDIKPIPFPPTIFTYKIRSKNNRDSAEKAMRSLRLILPYVMTLNQRLKMVKVTEKDGSVTIYQKGQLFKDGPFCYFRITINEIPVNIYYLKSLDNRITIFLPFADNYTAKYFEQDLPRLFLYYPLIGTQDFGINFLIHSRHFQPTEPRNGLYLNSDNEDNHTEESVNKSLLDEASQMIFDLIFEKSSLILNPIKLAKINFIIESDKPLLNDYFRELKSKWVNCFKDFPLVETELGRKKATEAVFMHSELFQSEEAFDSINTLINQFWKNISKKHLVREWTEIIDEWDLEEIVKIRFKDLALQIQTQGKLDCFENPNDLQCFYTYLIKEGQGDLFNNYKLLPNLKGEFRLLSGLNNNVSLPDVLIEIADVIMPDVPKRHIHPDFKFDLELAPYNRKNYVTEINTAIANVVNDNTLSNIIPAEFLAKLIEYCKITGTSETDNIPGKMVRLICQYYNHNADFIQVQVIKEDELDIRTPQKKLIRLFLNDLSKKDHTWVAENLDFLKLVIETGALYYDYEEMFKTLSVFPNQLNELTVQSYLQIEDNIPGEVKDIYDKVVKPPFPIRANLVHPDFSDFLKNKEKRTVRSLTEKIESIFSDDGQYLNINEHPFKDDILIIIQKITAESEWGKYFPILNGKRANIMLDMVTDDLIKKDVFSIISLKPEQINKLGQLARHKNLDEIIALGLKALDEEFRTKTDFQFKYEIGKRLESLIKEKLGADLAVFDVSVKDVQNGQDIVISLNGNEVYFIEVKSRWNSDSSIMMSKNQFTNAAANKEKYSLCCVEMSDYKNGQIERYEVDDIEIIFDRIKIINTIGFELEPLIKGILLTTDIENEITLTGDFKATIPQRLIKTGSSFNEFVNYLISKLKLV